MKILAQESGWLGKMVRNAKEASPAFAASWLERFDPALFPPDQVRGAMISAT